MSEQRNWRDCHTCRQIAAEQRASTDAQQRWITSSVWAALDGAVPREVLLAMSMAELHATHHVEDRNTTDSIMITGVRELVAHYTTKTVPRDEANDRATNLWNSWQAEVKQIRETADAEARAQYEADLREAQTRLLIVDALRHQAGTRKTMQAADVRAALDWVRGEEVPAFAVEHYRKISGVQRGAA